MFRFRKGIILLTMITAVIFVAGCDKDNTNGPSKTYDLAVKDVLGVTGKVTFTETSNTSTTVDIVLTNAPSGTHPANLYMYSTVEEGSIVKALNPVDATGKSSTVVNMTYDELIAYDGSIKVLKSSSEPTVILAQGDIGGNVVSTTNKSYTLTAIGTFGVSGTALFEKRENGNTLVTISLTGTIPGESYPATINLGSIASVDDGTIRKTLSSVNGTTGKSYTTIRKLDSGNDITYENWLVYVGYINIYQTSILTANIISHGNIGLN